MKQLKVQKDNFFKENTPVCFLSPWDVQNPSEIIFENLSSDPDPTPNHKYGHHVHEK